MPQKIYFEAKQNDYEKILYAVKRVEKDKESIQNKLLAFDQLNSQFMQLEDDSDEQQVYREKLVKLVKNRN